MVRAQDRPALKRIVTTIFSVEHYLHDELQAILYDDSLTAEQKADKYIDTVVDHLEYAPDTKK